MMAHSQIAVLAVRQADISEDGSSAAAEFGAEQTRDCLPLCWSRRTASMGRSSCRMELSLLWVGLFIYHLYSLYPLKFEILTRQRWRNAFIRKYWTLMDCWEC